MPRLTRVWIKTAFGYLIVALVLKTVLFIEGTPTPFGRNTLNPVVVHLLTVGWLTQLIFGVAWWLFPPRSPENPRGNERRAWFVYALLNAGLLLRVATEPWAALGGFGSFTLASSALLQSLAVWMFAFQLWPRVRGFGKRGA